MYEAMRRLQSSEVFNVPESSAHGILYGLLVCFTVVTVAALAMKEDSPVRAVLRPSDSFLSARGSSAWWAIALSFFASGMGAWIVYGTTEMGATRAVSIWGVIGYSTGSAFPAILLCWLGPKIKEHCVRGFSATDFALKRYGRLMHLHVCCISCFYMYIYMVAELTTIGNVYALLVGKDTSGNNSEHYTTRIAIAVACFTWLYTALAGLPASILTDKLQGAVIAALCTMLLVSATTQSRNEVGADRFDDATGWFSKGFEALVSLWIAIASAELFNQGNWQRVWAAKSDKDMRIGFVLGALLVTAVMLFFGAMGMIAYARDREAYDTYQKLAYLSFFDILGPLPRGWHLVTLALLTTLAASSLDTLQNGLASVLSHDLLNQKLSPNWSRLVVIGFNVAAVIQAADRFEVVPLFLVADLVCATCVGPLFAGLVNKDVEIFGPLKLVAPTEVGAFLGAVTGILAVIINGEINDVNKAENYWTGKVYDKGAMAYFWLTNRKKDGTPYECALCGTKTMVTFIVVPLIATVATFVFSAMDVAVGGDKAREPFLIVPRLDDLADQAKPLIADDVELTEKDDTKDVAEP